jgi:low affinity Fe/Cu permease
MKEFFRKFAQATADLVGSPWAFILALLVLIAWAITGPAFGFSDTWQLVINTGTTILTFLIVFLIQNTQNRDARAMHLKLDELIRSLDNARNSMVDLEDLSDDELARLQKEFVRLREKQGEVVEAAQEITEAVADLESQPARRANSRNGSAR